MQFTKKNVVLLYDENSTDDLLIMIQGLEAYLKQFSGKFELIAIECSKYVPKVRYSISTTVDGFLSRNANWLGNIRSKFQETKAIRQFKKQLKAHDSGKDIRTDKLQVEKVIEDVIATEAENSDDEKKLKARKLLNKPAISTKMVINNIIMRFTPSMVLCSTPESFKMALDVKKTHNYDTKVVGTILSFGADVRYLDRRADGYFVLNEGVKKAFVKFGIDDERISIIGIPFKNDTSIDTQEIRELLDIKNDLPIVLLDCGTNGVSSMLDSYNKLVESSVQYNLLVLYGKNIKLQALMAAKAVGRDRVILLLDEEQRKDAQQVSNILVSMPITGTIMKALTNDTIVVVTRPFGVIQKHNYKYLKHLDIVRVAKDANRVAVDVGELVLEKSEYNKMSKTRDNFLLELGKIDTMNNIALLEEKND